MTKHASDVILFLASAKTDDTGV